MLGGLADVDNGHHRFLQTLNGAEFVGTVEVERLGLVGNRLWPDAVRSWQREGVCRFLFADVVASHRDACAIQRAVDRGIAVVWPLRPLSELLRPHHPVSEVSVGLFGSTPCRSCSGKPVRFVVVSCGKVSHF